jgi:hypothetical protein
MKVRELLRYEIWSKETSRKILRPVGKCLKWVAIVSGVLIVLIWIVYAIESHWLTNGEEGAGRAGLTQIEELEKLIDRNCSQFSTIDSKASVSVSVAAQKAWTIRDHTVAFDLWLYHTDVEQIQTNDLLEGQSKLMMQKNHLQWYSNPKLEGKDRSLRREELQILRTELHKQLD